MIHSTLEDHPLIMIVLCRALCGDPELGFCMDGSWSGGVRVDRDGRGLAQVWTRQIQQLNRVSVPTARAVTTAYPSPSLLLQVRCCETHLRYCTLSLFQSLCVNRPMKSCRQRRRDAGCWLISLWEAESKRGASVLMCQAVYIAY